MPAQYKLNQALAVINRRYFFVIMDDVTSILESLVEMDEEANVKSWTVKEIVSFVKDVMELK